MHTRALAEAEAVAGQLDEVEDPRQYVRFGGRARPISDQTSRRAWQRAQVLFSSQAQQLSDFGCTSSAVPLYFRSSESVFFTVVW